MHRHQRIGLLLCLLLSTQVFIIEGKQIDYHRDLINQRSVARVYHDDNTALCPLDGSTCPLENPKKEKRVIVTALIAASIIVSLANVAFDIYLKIEGCCGLYPSACIYEKEFIDLKKELAKRAEDMNDQYTQSKNVLTWMKSTNRHNMDIWLNVKRIMELNENIITYLDPELINKYNNKSYELKEALHKHNKTVANMNLSQISTEYVGVFDTVESTFKTLAPIAGGFLFGLYKGYSMYKTFKITQALSATQGASQLSNSVKAQRILGVTNVNKYISQTVTAQTKAVSAAGKFAKFAKFAGAAMSVISIGLEIYSAIMKVKGCQKVRDDAKKARDTLLPERAKFQKTEAELIEFHSNLTKSYDVNVKGQITSDLFLNYTASIKQMALGASNSPKYLQDAGMNIETFNHGIISADYSKTVSLQKKLIIALENITFTWSCYEKKIKTISYAYSKCKVGDGTMEFVWKNAVKLYEINAFSCTTATGHSYTTYDETKTYVEGRMTKEGYQTDCVLNNSDFFDSTCSYYTQGYSDSENAEKTGLTVDQAKWFVSRCPPATVSPRIASMICVFKSFMNLENVKKQYSKYNQAEVESTYNACPTPVMTENVKAVICNGKNKDGQTLAQTLINFSQYAASDVTSTYNACVAS